MKIKFSAYISENFQSWKDQKRVINNWKNPANTNIEFDTVLISVLLKKCAERRNNDFEKKMVLLVANEQLNDDKASNKIGSNK